MRTLLPMSTGHRAGHMILAGALCLALSWRQAGAAEDATVEAQRLLTAAAFRGGLIAHVGCGKGELTAALRRQAGVVVHGLDSDATEVDAARARVREQGSYGPVSIEQWSGTTLPYADNLVNLLILSETPGRVSLAETTRVLAPGGVMVIAPRARPGPDQPGVPNPDATSETLTPVALADFPGWTAFRTPRPAAMDEWTHFLHGPDNNAVARDAQVGIPSQLQWTTGPRWSRDHDTTPSIFAPVSAGGRLYYIEEDGPVAIIDERIPDQYFLTARDAFNGIQLWRRPLADWYSSRLIWGHIPVQVHRRLVACGDRVFVTLGLQAPVTALDPATGATVHEYAGTEQADELVVDGDVLLLTLRKTQPLDATLASRDRKRFRPGFKDPETSADTVMAFRTSGECLWRKTRQCRPLTLALQGARVFFVEGDNVVCLDATNGEERWRTPCSARTLVVHEGVVLAASGHPTPANAIQLTALSADDGRQLWTTQGDCLPNFHFFHAPVDVFVVQNLVWATAHDLEWDSKPGSGELLGLDLLSGEARRSIPLTGAFTAGHHARCYKGKATERYLLFGKRGTEFLDLSAAPTSRPVDQCQWVRGACRYGILPCNGLLYAPSHSCACYPGAQLDGFNALAPHPPEQDATPPASDAPRLEKGPAYDNPAVGMATPQPATEWPTYRGDAARSGAAAGPIAAEKLKTAWTTGLHAPISAPVVAAGKVFVAEVDTHSVHALDAGTGERLWSWTAGGRVDSPPTVHGDRVFFGCRDGWVYCLRAADGALAWRFRAAPAERRISAFGQIESAWPVHGSVLLRDNTVYCAAGRSSFLDGGIRVFGLDANTGTPRFETLLSGTGPEAGAKPITETRMPGAVSDVLASDDTRLYLRHVPLSLDLRPPSAADFGFGVKGPSHLLPWPGFLDDAMFNRTPWKLGFGGEPCQLLAFDQESAYGMRAYWGISWNCPVYRPGEGYLVFRQERKAPPVKPDAKGAAAKPEPFSIDYTRFAWYQRVPVRVQAMLLAGPTAERQLLLAGPPDVIDAKDPRGSFEGRLGGTLWILAAKDGTKLAEYPLDSPPVWDGLAAAGGRLYLSTRNGHIVCLAPGKGEG